MNYEEEQANELEALQSIFYAEDEVRLTNPPSQFAIRLTPEGQQDEEQEGLLEASSLDAFVKAHPDYTRLYLDIQYTPRYPDEVPLLSIVNGSSNNNNNSTTTTTTTTTSSSSSSSFIVLGLDSSEQAALLDHARSVCEENVGMAMVFTLVASLREYLEQVVRQRQQDRIQRQEEAAKQEEEEEQRRFQGTRVTRESFLAWFTRFRREMDEEDRKRELFALAASSSGGGGGGGGGTFTTSSNVSLGSAANQARLDALLTKEKAARAARLTGRKLFETDTSLAKSDITFMDEGDVDVDINLFEGKMEGLELEDEDDDEENNILATFQEDDD